MIDTPAFRDFAIPGASKIMRVFLPLNYEDDRSVTSTWSALASEAPVELSSDVDVVDYLGWGRGTGSFDSPWRPASGFAPASTIGLIMELLRLTTGESSGWLFRSFPEVGTLPGGPYSGDLIELREFASMWENDTLPGSLQYEDSVLLTAPAYADSVIISGPETILPLGKALGLEVISVWKDAKMPIAEW